MKDEQQDGKKRNEARALRKSLDQAIRERDEAAAEAEKMKQTIEELKAKHGNVENVLGGLVSNLQHEVDEREARIHKLEDEHDIGSLPAATAPVSAVPVTPPIEPNHGMIQEREDLVPEGDLESDPAFHELLSESKRRRELWESRRDYEDDMWGEEAVEEVKRSLGLRILLGLMGVAVVGLGVSAVLLWVTGRNAMAASTQSGAVDDGLSGDTIEWAIEDQLKEAERREQEIVEMFQQFAGKKSIEDKVEMCWHPRRTKLHMKIYEAKNVDSIHVEDISVSDQMVLLPDGSIAWRVTIRHKDEKQPRVTYVHEGEGGKLLIDWHTYTRFQPKPWEDFLDERPNGVFSMNLIVGTGADQHPGFPADKYYGVRVRGWEDDAYRWCVAFIEKNHPDAAAFISKMNQLSASEDDHGLPYRFEHYILKIRHVKDKSTPFSPLLIEEIVADGFVYPEDLKGLEGAQ